MGNPKSTKQLAKFLDYVLARHPEEFGLIPDENGFVKLKELLQAVNEEDGWRHIRKSHINELFLTVRNPNLEMKDKLIRAVERESKTYSGPPENIPKLLYTCVRNKSYHHIVDKGVYPTRHPHVILSTNMELALRIGKRRDPSPVVLTVNVAQAETLGTHFSQAAETLFLADFLPSDAFTGPPLPKIKPETKKPEKTEKKRVDENQGHTPGSYMLNAEDFQKSKKNKSKDKGPSWKKDRKRLRKEKENPW